MGYESKLYVVEKTGCIDDFNGKQKRYARVIAMFDMCRIDFLSDMLREAPETDCYIYADDGDTPILEDCYGRSLTEVSVDEIVNFLGAAVIEGETYRRIYPTLSFLKTISDQQRSGAWKNIVVLHYGH